MSGKVRIHIYRIYFPESGKCYIGQTANMKRRMMYHLLKSQQVIGHAFRKYNEWEIMCLHICHSYDEADRVEIEEIRNFNSIAPNGYNLTRGGEGTGGLKWTDEQKKNASEIHKGLQVGKDNPMFGKKRPDLSARNKTLESRERIKLANTGRPRLDIAERNKSPEMRAKVRASKLGKKRSPFSDGWKAKISLSQRRGALKRLETKLQETFGNDYDSVMEAARKEREQL